MHINTSKILSFTKYFVIIIIVLIVVLPILWLVLLSFQKPADIITWPPSLFFEPTYENYRNMLSQKSNYLSFSKVFLNSIIITLVSVPVSIMLASIAAYSIGRLKPKGSKQLNYIIIGARMIPPIALVVPLYVIYSYLNLLDTKIGVILPFISFNIPLATWMLEGFFEDMPKDLEEAATIDGCTPFQAFLRVILPLAAPGVAATSIFAFILSWNELTIPLALSVINAATLPVLISQVKTESGILWGNLAAISVIMIIPIIIFAVFATKYLIKGLASGSVKG